MLLVMMLTTMTAWAETETVSYIDADGETQTVTATVIEAGTTYYPGGTYVIKDDVNFTSKVTFDGSTTIICVDEKTMQVTIADSETDSGIHVRGNLTLYGQCGEPPGGIMVESGNDAASGFKGLNISDNLTIYGGVAAFNHHGNNGGSGIKAANVAIYGGEISVICLKADGIISGSVDIHGGLVLSDTSNGKGISANTITLGYTNADDRIRVSSYEGSVSVRDGQTLRNYNQFFSGAIDDNSTIGNKRLYPGDFYSSATDEYTIHTATGWGMFCDRLAADDGKTIFSGKTVKLGDDISVTRMADGQPFTGTFDGDGHTLTLNYGTADAPVNEQFVAPFVETARDTSPVFRNLTIDGTIYDGYTGSEAHNVGGLIGHLFGDVTIEHCVSRVEIHAKGGAGGFVGLCEHSVSFTDCHSAAVVHSADGNNSGFVAWSRSSGWEINFTGCLFDGKLLQQNGTGHSNGGFIGWKGDAKIVNITNCLCAPAPLADGEMMATDGSATFSREHSNYPATITNSYYTAAFDIAQGKQARSITAGQWVTVSHAGVANTYSASGITAYKATGASADSDPFIAGLLYNNNVVDVLYAGSDEVVSLTLSNTGAPDGYTFDGGYAASAGTLSGTENPYTLTMPDENVTISAAWLRLPYVTVNVTGSGTVTCGEQNATDGNPFDVTTEKGASVVLTLAPTDGNAVRSVAYGYTNNSGTTASGFKLPISGTTATLTVPDGLKDGTGVTVTVTFVPALNGGADEASAVALTDNTVTDLGGGWYKVENDISFDHTLNLLADTYLTIAEGKTMTVNTASGEAIDSEYTLNVSGEGTLSVATTGDYGIAVCVGNYVQTGATVTASGYIGIRCTDNFAGVTITNDFTFSGGQLTATGPGYGDGIWADNDITLSCSNATDFIQASSYRSKFGAVKIAEGKALTDGTEASNGMNGYSGTLTNEQRTAIGGKTLHRAVTTSYVDASGTLHENVIAIPLDNTMTTLAAGWYVVNENVDYTGQITLGDDVNLILADGGKMSIGTEQQPVSECGIDGYRNADVSLAIYGQSAGSGHLYIYSEETGIDVDDDYEQNGGCVTISVGGLGIVTESGDVTLRGGTLSTIGACGINTSGCVNILGGKCTAKSNHNFVGIDASTSGNITLGWKNADDFIDVSSYALGHAYAVLKVADGQALIDADGNIYTGTLLTGDDDYAAYLALNNLTLTPAVVLADDASNATAISDAATVCTGGKTIAVQLSGRTLSKSGEWNTLCLPFDVDDFSGTPLEGATVKELNATTSNLDNGTLTLNFTDADVIEAGKPYIVRWGTPEDNPGGTIVDPVFSGVTVSSTTPTAVNFTGGSFVGQYSPFSITADNIDEIILLSTGNRLGYSKNERTLRSFRAHFEVPTSGGVREFVLNFDDENTTGIISPAEIKEITDCNATLSKREMAGAWYSLDGRKLDAKPTKKGLYIHNGNKVVIK